MKYYIIKILKFKSFHQPGCCYKVYDNVNNNK